MVHILYNSGSTSISIGKQYINSPDKSPSFSVVNAPADNRIAIQLAPAARDHENLGQ